MTTEDESLQKRGGRMMTERRQNNNREEAEQQQRGGRMMTKETKNNNSIYTKFFVKILVIFHCSFSYMFNKKVHMVYVLPVYLTVH